MSRVPGATWFLPSFVEQEGSGGGVRDHYGLRKVYRQRKESRIPTLLTGTPGTAVGVTAGTLRFGWGDVGEDPLSSSLLRSSPSSGGRTCLFALRRTRLHPSASSLPAPVPTTDSRRGRPVTLLPFLGNESDQVCPPPAVPPRCPGVLPPPGLGQAQRSAGELTASGRALSSLGYAVVGAGPGRVLR